MPWDQWTGIPWRPAALIHREVTGGWGTGQHTTSTPRGLDLTWHEAKRDSSLSPAALPTSFPERRGSPSRCAPASSHRLPCSYFHILPPLPCSYFHILAGFRDPPLQRLSTAKCFFFIATYMSARFFFPRGIPRLGPDSIVCPICQEQRQRMK